LARLSVSGLARTRLSTDSGCDPWPSFRLDFSGGRCAKCGMRLSLFLRPVPLALSLFAVASLPSVQAGSATWKADPVDNDWNNPANWTPETVPNGPDDSATFSVSNVTDISISSDTEVHSIVFASGASSYTITPDMSAAIALKLSGTGITNKSGMAQNFVVGVKFNASQVASIGFLNSASAGAQTVFTVNGSNALSTDVGAIVFHDASSAGSATFFNLPSPSGLLPGRINFHDEATAGNAIIASVSSAVTNGYGGQVYFYGFSSAGRATFFCEGGQASGGYTESFVEFRDSSTAAHASLTANGATVSGAPGGSIYFQSLSRQTPSTGSATLIANGGSNGLEGGKLLLEGQLLGAARVIISEEGNLDVSGNAGLGAPLPIGSLEGDGHVFLGRTLLEIISKKNTKFSGQISDLGGIHSFTNGMVCKSGTGRLVLTEPSDYTGGTIITDGELVVNNGSGSATGSGPVQVNRGQVAGGGFISGGVTLGTGSESGAVLSPGQNAQSPGTLTVFSTVNFKSDAAYDCNLNSDIVTADQVAANGVTIDGAVIEITDAGTAILAPGTTFTLMSNMSANPISGRFSNLSDGDIVTVNGNHFQASYEGGDGNDLTLTVVP
jgi:autotransporter-associated beta strand protein